MPLLVLNCSFIKVNFGRFLKDQKNRPKSRHFLGDFIFPKNRPIGEISPNLVTLAAPRLFPAVVFFQRRPDERQCPGRVIFLQARKCQKPLTLGFTPNLKINGICH